MEKNKKTKKIKMTVGGENRK